MWTHPMSGIARKNFQMYSRSCLNQFEDKLKKIREEFDHNEEMIRKNLKRIQ